MDAYTSFAAVYDTFMDNIPYEEWKSYLEELLKEYGVQDGLVLDLGCGTGTMTELLAADGYDMIRWTIPRKCWRSPEKSRSSQDMRFYIFFRICGSLNCMVLWVRYLVSVIL